MARPCIIKLISERILSIYILIIRRFILFFHYYLFKNILQIFIGAMLPPGGSSNVVTSRFLRHMNILGIDSFRETTLTKIFTAILDWHFQKGFSESVSHMSKVKYFCIIKKLLILK